MDQVQNRSTILTDFWISMSDIEVCLSEGEKKRNWGFERVRRGGPPNLEELGCRFFSLIFYPHGSAMSPLN